MRTPSQERLATQKPHRHLVTVEAKSSVQSVRSEQANESDLRNEEACVGGSSPSHCKATSTIQTNDPLRLQHVQQYCDDVDFGPNGQSVCSYAEKLDVEGKNT